ncbi:MAG: lysine 2,3-aminomutase [Bacteroidales bacterium]|nr:lysine 2,3-aminomutase [Bacteroidales bacterium]
MKVYKAYNSRNFIDIPQLSALNEEQKNAISIVSQVLPFKTNNYVIDELIDWNSFESDPMFILNFPQKDMLKKLYFKELKSMLSRNVPKQEVARYVNEIRMGMNPHPAGQLEHNVPTLNGEKIQGIQHKYRETMLFFPSQGQTCHAYCTFCFRWPQFTGMGDIKFAMKQTDLMIEYLRQNPGITDILFTGGDPMIMKASVLKKYIDAILDAGLPQIKTIRIGTKSLSFWPYRFLTDEDSGEIIELFRKVSDRGIHLAIMAHFNHYKELQTEALEEAVNLIRQTGAQIRTQSPVLNHINASGEVWETMWKRQVELGMVPYYMFMARNTGAQDYFSVNMQSAVDIFNEAYQKVSGICRTVRGPSMSAGPGKVHINGTAEINGKKVYVLSFIQGRLPEWVGKPFFAEYDPEALWLDDLKPAFGEKEFFYEKDYNKLLKISTLPDRSISSEDLQSA